MPLSSILLHAPAEQAGPGHAPSTYAAALARSRGAALSALVFDLDVTSSGWRGQDGGGTDIRTRGAAEAADALRADLVAAGIDATVVTRHSHAQGVHEVIAEHARLHDLAVVGCSDDGLLSERDVAEHLLFESGRPLILIPGSHRGFAISRPVVAWDGSRAAARALGDAISLVRSAEELVLLTFSDDKEIAPTLSASETAEALRRRGLTPRLVAAERGRRGIADAISEEAARLGADLLIMGGYGHSRLREMILGGATRAILGNPPLPTLMSH